MKMAGIIPLALMWSLSACSSGSFSSAARGGASGTTSPAGENSAPGKTSSADNTAPGEKKAVFNFGAKSTRADFVFVYDNSASMKKPLDDVQLGFASLEAARWPEDTLVAMMNTVPGDPAANLARVHPDVNRYANIELEPGFLSFVSEEARQRFLAASPGRANDYLEPMCTNKWFKPSDKNANGASCFKVSLQSPFENVIVEAGLVAFAQLIQKATLNKETLFRKDTSLNVVFISDTQDPGQRNASRIVELRKPFPILKNEILENSAVASVKFHGITPSLDCKTSEESPTERGLGTPYQDAINASGGKWLDFCDGPNIRTDYKPVAEQIIDSVLAEPVFTLNEPASRILRVVIDGKVLPAADVELASDKKTVRIKGLDAKQNVVVNIIYAP